ncbi:MAG: hypothetical protein K6T66_09865 [Peptococcaceae bacterium]|nr:hypothetical protein [Peptococcaceae bacterium]
MYWPRWYVLNRKRVVPMLLLIALFLVLLWGAVSLACNLAMSDSDLFNRALSNTLACSSYRYSVEVRQGGRDMVTLVEGERVEPDRVHIKGAMQKSQMEFVQIGDTTYMKDPWSDRWFTLKGNSLAQSELFMTEFNPLGLFKFKDVPVIKKTGSDKLEGVKTEVLELRPIVANPFLEVKYTDFKFKVWVDPGQKLIRKAEMAAHMPGGGEGMVVVMKFWGFNEKIRIDPPRGNIVDGR